MIKKKGKFLTFVFSLLPGAGHMYMGFMKMGISLMGLFFLTIFLSSWLNIGPLIYVLPVLWFYAFFDALNKSSLSDEEFYALEDRFLFSNVWGEDQSAFVKKNKLYIGIALVVFGAYMLLDMLWGMVGAALPNYLWHQINNGVRSIPQLVVGGLILVIGIKLILGKKREGGDA